jgi:hypothetical protein
VESRCYLNPIENSGSLELLVRNLFEKVCALHDTKSFFLQIFTMPQALQNGVSATASVLKRLLHPKKVISKKYAKIAPQEHLDDLLVLKKGGKAIKSKETTIIFFHHDDFPNQILYMADWFYKVLKEGPE